MIWGRKKRKQQRDEERDMPTTLTPPAQGATPEDVRRAEHAARLAAMSLDEAKSRRQEIDETVEKLARLNRENGFAQIIRDAFGS
jgi:hypothetical protein